MQREAIGRLGLWSACLVMAACAAGFGGETIRVGWVNFNLSDDWFKYIQEFAQKEAARIEKEDGVKFEWVIRDGTGNAERQIKIVDDFITMGDIDMFLFNAVDDVAMGKAIEKMNKAMDIPIGSAGNPAISGKFLYVSLDNVAATRELGEVFIKMMTDKYGAPADWKRPGQKKGVILEIWGPPSLQIVKERHVGFRQALDPILAANPHLEVVEGLSNWSPDTAFKTCSDLIERHRDDLIGIYVDDDTGATEGAWRAMELARMAFPNTDERHIPLVTYDGTMSGIQAVRDGKVDSIVDQSAPAYSHITFRMLYNWHKNGYASLPKAGDILDEAKLSQYFDLEGEMGAKYWAPVEVREEIPGILWFAPASALVPQEKPANAKSAWGNYVYMVENGHWPE